MRAVIAGLWAVWLPTMAQAHCMAFGYEPTAPEANGCEDLHDAFDDEFGLQPFILIGKGPIYEVRLHETIDPEELAWSVFAEYQLRACELLSEHPLYSPVVVISHAFEEDAGTAGTLRLERACAP